MRARPLSSGALAAALALPALVAVPAQATAQTAPAATEADIVINEVESNGDPVGDWVELANTNTAQDLDISGWTLVDNDPDHTPYAFPAGTVIESGGYLSVYTDVGTNGFGLGKEDSVTLRDASGAVVDSTSWTAHAAVTWGRIPDMTGAFGETTESTRDAKNAGGTPTTPPVETSPWPTGPVTISPVALGGDFAGEDMSGVDIAADGTAYVVNNGTGTLYVLSHDAAAGTYAIARTFKLTYADGSGIPDAEGVTVGPDGVVYVATERNNADKGTSRPSVLRFQLPATGTTGTLNAAAEYDLSGITGTLGANTGLEAVEFLPDVLGGVLAVGVEATGTVYFVKPAADGTFTVAQTYRSPFDSVAALDYDAATRKLRVLCDDACDGMSLEMTFTGTEFVTDGTIYARPAGMPNLANEGFAAATETVPCTIDGAAGTATRIRYLWTDDGATEGVGLRTGTTEAGPCVADAPLLGSTADLGLGLTGSLGTVVAELGGGFLVDGSLGGVLPAAN